MIKIILIIGLIVAIWYFLDKSRPTSDDNIEDTKPSDDDQSESATRQMPPADQSPMADDAQIIEEAEYVEVEAADAPSAAEKTVNDIDGLSDKLKGALLEAGYSSVSDVKNATDEQLLAIKGIGQKSLEKIRQSSS